MKSMLKRTFATIMTVVIVITAISFSAILTMAFAEDDVTFPKYKTGDIFEFGSYPQSMIKDKNLIEKLNSLDKEWVSYDYYSGESSYNSMCSGDWMKYSDVFYNNLKYRAVYFKEYRPYKTTQFKKESSSFQDNNGYNTNQVYWFVFEPIEWRVLDPLQGLVVSETIIDAQPYCNTVFKYGQDKYNYPAIFNNEACNEYANDYITSSIRQWLNNDFYDTAFSKVEKLQLKSTQIYNNEYEVYYEDYNRQSCIDNVFLLSYKDVFNLNYGFDNLQVSSDRKTKGSEYAQSQGLWVFLKSSQISGPLNKYQNDSYYNSNWLLRTAGDYSVKCCSVSYIGSVDHDTPAFDSSFGIRPACRIESVVNRYTEKFYLEKVDESFISSYDVRYGEQLIIPEEPHKDGYKFIGWKDWGTDQFVDISKEIMDSTKGKKYYAVWEPEQYTAKLMVEGFLYKEIKYTYGQKSINLPAVPEKYGYTGKWEPYSLDIDGVTINAIYTKLPAKIKSVSVFDFDVNYKDTIKITPKIETDSNSNYTIKFKSSNNKIATVDNNGNVYAAKKGNATITCTVTDEYGNQVSDTCNVTVGYAWWQWIIKIVLFGWIWY